MTSLGQCLGQRRASGERDECRCRQRVSGARCVAVVDVSRRGCLDSPTERSDGALPPTGDADEVVAAAQDRRSGLGFLARKRSRPFLSDEEKKVITELEIVDTTDKDHPVAIPYTFVLDRDRTIYKIYNGWWYVGRPTVEELRMDLRALMSRRQDWWYDKTPPPYAQKSDELTFHMER